MAENQNCSEKFPVKLITPLTINIAKLVRWLHLQMCLSPMELNSRQPSCSHCPKPPAQDGLLSNHEH